MMSLKRLKKARKCGGSGRLLVGPVRSETAEMAPDAFLCTFLCIMSSLLCSFAAPSGFWRCVWRTWFFCAFFWARNPYFHHRLWIIATQHLICNAPQRVFTIICIWHDLQGRFVALLFCNYSQNSSRNPIATRSCASTPATVLTGWAPKCKIVALIVIYKSMLTISNTGVMRTEDRSVIWTPNCCLNQVSAGCPPATEQGQNCCCCSLYHRAFSVILHVYDWIQLKWSAGTVWSPLVAQVVAASPDHRLKISCTIHWFTGVCSYFRSMSVTLCVIDAEFDAQEYFNK